MGCHQIVGYQTGSPQVYKVPMIAGQDAKYIESALKAYRAGDRKQMQMRGIASSLGDEDIADIAALLRGPRQAGPRRSPGPRGARDRALPRALQAKVTTCAACHGANFCHADRRHDPAPGRAVRRLSLLRPARLRHRGQRALRPQQRHR